MDHNVIGGLLAAAETAVAALLIFSFVAMYRKNSKGITKKNLVYLAPTFIINYLLCLAAAFYNGETVDIVFCASLISKSLGMFGFKYEVDLLRPIVTANGLFCFDLVLSVLITASSLLISVASIFGRAVGGFFARRKAMKSGCDIVLGDCPSALKYIKTNKNVVLWDDGIENGRYKALVDGGVTVMRTRLSVDGLKRAVRGAHSVIVFRDSGRDHEELIRTFVDSEMLGEDGLKLRLEVCGAEEQVVYRLIDKIDESKSAYISCFNKYELAARRLAVGYPVSRFVPRSFYNDNCTLKDGKGINVVFLGFGKINYHIFRTFSMLFQFVKQDGKKLASAPVHYHIFDHNGSRLNNELFSRLDYEFGYEFENTELPPPDRICELEKTRNADIYSVEARKFFRSCVNADSFTYFVVSLENDFANAACAQSLKRLFRGEENYVIFTRAENRSEGVDSFDGKLFYFGDDLATYLRANVVDDGLTDRARTLNYLYDASSDKNSAIYALPPSERYAAAVEALKSPETRRKVAADWAKLNDAQRYSNFYAALGIPFKLGLMGFGVCAAGKGDVGEDEFKSKYVNSGRDGGYTDRKFYFGTETGNVLAFSEHLRWNALYILSDYKQMPLGEMRAVNGIVKHKDDARRLHGCLTTYYGLDELISYKADLLAADAKSRGEKFDRDAVLTELSSIYRYDYMALDGLFEDAKLYGYGLVHGLGGRS